MEDGYEVVLINSNPATIMTDPMMADAVYLLPLTTDSIKEIVEKEKPDAVLPTMGGQTALNLAGICSMRDTGKNTGYKLLALIWMPWTSRKTVSSLKT